MSGELIRRGTRNAFRSLATGIPQAAVAGFWQDEGFAPVDELDYDDTSVRRWTFQSYAERVEWGDLAQVERALRVFEWQLRWLARQETHTDRAFDDVRAWLDRDGLVLDDENKIHWSRPVGLEHSLHALDEASGIRAELDRAHRALPEDPAGAIGAAKQLIEATAKVVLHERGLPVNDNATVPDLVKAAQQALNLHPSAVQPGADSADGLKKILGGVSAIAIGIAELRNRGYGSGHGQTRAPAGLGPRHARLAVNAATTWCQLLLDTLADPAAPWRTQPTEGNTT
ncbi:abortive infection family protein [Prauserella flavalba]|uniref:abortive infection family protein n=1 Tax=Prauserella flavalba TaxID=1477506 RepID=UPI0036E82ACE